MVADYSNTTGAGVCVNISPNSNPNKKLFILKIQYGTGEAYMLVPTPDIIKAVELFKKKYKESIPDTKEFGMPEIVSAEVHPILYSSIYDEMGLGE